MHANRARWTVRPLPVLADRRRPATLKEKRMYKHILIPTDGTPIADKAVRAGIEFAREAGAKVTFFTAVPEYDVPNEGSVMARQVISLAEHARRCERIAHRVLAPAADKARAAQLEFRTHYGQCNRPWEAIVDAAKVYGCDAIIMGSHGRSGLSRLVHGSQTIDVLTHTDIPTLVVR
jgi:nucleotide-binding universal stress UspA family protein